MEKQYTEKLSEEAVKFIQFTFSETGGDNLLPGVSKEDIMSRNTCRNIVYSSSLGMMIYISGSELIFKNYEQVTNFVRSFELENKDNMVTDKALINAFGKISIKNSGDQEKIQNIKLIENLDGGELEALIIVLESKVFALNLKNLETTSSNTLSVFSKVEIKKEPKLKDVNIIDGQLIVLYSNQELILAEGTTIGDDYEAFDVYKGKYLIGIKQDHSFKVRVLGGVKKETTFKVENTKWNEGNLTDLDIFWPTSKSLIVVGQTEVEEYGEKDIHRFVLLFNASKPLTNLEEGVETKSVSFIDDQVMENIDVFSSQDPNKLICFDFIHMSEQSVGVLICNDSQNITLISARNGFYSLIKILADAIPCIPNDGFDTVDMAAVIAIKNPLLSDQEHLSLKNTKRKDDEGVPFKFYLQRRFLLMSVTGVCIIRRYKDTRPEFLVGLKDGSSEASPNLILPKKIGISGNIVVEVAKKSEEDGGFLINNQQNTQSMFDRVKVGVNQDEDEEEEDDSGDEEQVTLKQNIKSNILSSFGGGLKNTVAENNEPRMQTSANKGSLFSGSFSGSLFGKKDKDKPENSLFSSKMTKQKDPFAKIDPKNTRSFLGKIDLPLESIPSQDKKSTLFSSPSVLNSKTPPPENKKESGIFKNTFQPSSKIEFGKKQPDSKDSIFGGGSNLFSLSKKKDTSSEKQSNPFLKIENPLSKKTNVPDKKNLGSKLIEKSLKPQQTTSKTTDNKKNDLIKDKDTSKNESTDQTLIVEEFLKDSKVGQLFEETKEYKLDHSNNSDKEETKKTIESINMLSVKMKSMLTRVSKTKFPREVISKNSKIIQLFKKNSTNFKTLKKDISDKRNELKEEIDQMAETSKTQKKFLHLGQSQMGQIKSVGLSYSGRHAYSLRDYSQEIISKFKNLERKVGHVRQTVLSMNKIKNELQNIETSQKVQEKQENAIKKKNELSKKLLLSKDKKEKSGRSSFFGKVKRVKKTDMKSEMLPSLYLDIKSKKEEADSQIQKISSLTSNTQGGINCLEKQSKLQFDKSISKDKSVILSYGVSSQNSNYPFYEYYQEKEYLLQTMAAKVQKISSNNLSFSSNKIHMMPSFLESSSTQLSEDEDFDDEDFPIFKVTGNGGKSSTQRTLNEIEDILKKDKRLKNIDSFSQKKFNLKLSDRKIKPREAKKSSLGQSCKTNTLGLAPKSGGLSGMNFSSKPKTSNPLVKIASKPKESKGSILGGGLGVSSTNLFQKIDSKGVKKTEPKKVEKSESNKQTMNLGGLFASSKTMNKPKKKEVADKKEEPKKSTLFGSTKISDKAEIKKEPVADPKKEPVKMGGLFSNEPKKKVLFPPKIKQVQGEVPQDKKQDNKFGSLNLFGPKQDSTISKPTKPTPTKNGNKNPESTTTSMFNFGSNPLKDTKTQKGGLDSLFKTGTSNNINKKPEENTVKKENTDQGLFGEQSSKPTLNIFGQKDQEAGQKNQGPTNIFSQSGNSQPKTGLANNLFGDNNGIKISGMTNVKQENNKGDPKQTGGFNMMSNTSQNLIFGGQKSNTPNNNILNTGQNKQQNAQTTPQSNNQSISNQKSFGMFGQSTQNAFSGSMFNSNQQNAFSNFGQKNPTEFKKIENTVPKANNSGFGAASGFGQNSNFGQSSGFGASGFAATNQVNICEIIQKQKPKQNNSMNNSGPKQVLNFGNNMSGNPLQTPQNGGNNFLNGGNTGGNIFGGVAGGTTIGGSTQGAFGGMGMGMGGFTIGGGAIPTNNATSNAFGSSMFTARK